MRTFRTKIILTGLLLAGACGPVWSASGPQTLTGLIAASAPLSAPAPVAQIAPPAPVRVVGASEGPAVGLLDPTRDLGSELWSGSHRGRIVSLLTGALPLADPALRALTKRIVLSAADAPNGKAKRALITTRIAELLHAGMVSQAGELAARSKLPGDKDFSRVQADALLYAGRTDVVCGSATNRRLSDAHPFWLELRAYCAHANGNSALEELTGVVLSAQVPDPAFKTLYADVRDKKGDIPAEYPHPSALHVFLLRQLKLPLPPVLAEKGGVPENVFVLRDRREPATARMAAAEKLAPVGALRVTDFHDLLSLAGPASSDIQDALSLAPQEDFVAGQVLLHLAAARAPDIGRKVALMRLALKLGADAGMPFLAARFQADVLKTLQPQRDADMAFVGRAQLMAGEDNLAGTWLMGDNPSQAIPLMGQSGPAAGGALQALMIRIAGMRVPGAKNNKGDGSDEGNADKKKPQRPLASPQQLLTLRLVTALMPMPDGLETRYPQAFAVKLPGVMPDAKLMEEIRTSARKPGGHGEAMLAMMKAIRTVGWANLAPEATLRFVRILRDLGLKAHARAFAREAMLLYQPPVPPPADTPAQ